MTIRTRTFAAVGALVLLPALLASCGSSNDAKRDESSGQITEAADASVFSLQVGDCLDYNSMATGEITSASTIPCSDPHDSEIFAELTLPDGDFPSDVETQADEYCTTKFATFIGVAYEQSSHLMTYLYPTQTSWEQGNDRVIQCIVVSQENVTESLQGSGI